MKLPKFFRRTKGGIETFSMRGVKREEEERRLIFTPQPGVSPGLSAIERLVADVAEAGNRETAQLIEAQGGKVSGSVSKKTNYVVAGTEAGGHCGEISTMVLVPEVLQAVEDFKGIDVLAAGGIATGRQMAACMAMGAAGAWTASVWLTTVEAETTPTVKKKMLAATSRDTVRSRSRTGSRMVGGSGSRIRNWRNHRPALVRMKASTKVVE